jgi:hypothetical protein
MKTIASIIYLLAVLIGSLLFSKCVSHSDLLKDPNTPMLCKYSLECMAYHEKTPTACSNYNDLCSWVSRETYCTDKSKNPEFLENGKFGKREIYLDCMSRQK